MSVCTPIPVTARVAFSVLAISMLASAVMSQEQITVPAGTRLVVAPTATLRTGDIDSGDPFTVVLVTDLVAGGMLAAHRGDTVTGTVVTAKKAKRVAGKAELELQLQTIHAGGHPVSCSSVVWGVEGEKSRELRKMAAKAALGGVVGGAAMAKRMVATSSALAVITPGKQIEVANGAFMEFYLAGPASMPVLAHVDYSDKDTAFDLFRGVMNDNLKRRTQYGWTREITVAKDGDVKLNKRMLVRFDTLGNQTEEPIGDQDEGGRGVRGRLKKKKLKKMNELLAGIQKLLAAYSLADPELSRKFFDGAAASHAAGAMTGMIQFVNIDVIGPNDWAAIWFDNETMRPRKLLFRTIMEEKVLQGEVDYAEYGDGMIQIGQANVRIPGDGLAVTIANDDYHKTQ